MENIKKLQEKYPLLEVIVRVSTSLLLLYLFLIGVKTLSTGLKLMGSDFARQLFDLTDQPFISLMAGMLATVLFQSSSVTTSIIVGLVASGVITIGGAIPMIMGANLGTSVTNTLVSLGYIRNTGNFKRAFAAATVHDFFNILTVSVLLPLELAFGFIEKMAVTAANLMYGSLGGLTYSSPVKAAIKPWVSGIKSFSLETFGSNWAGIVMIILAFVFIISALSMIVRVMSALVESNKGKLINKLLSSNAVVTIGFGIVLTIGVQSSSITTSLLIPMAGSGLLNLHSIFPITIGANIGTTATALLAALTGNVAGLSIALVHLIFNVLGTLIFYPHPAMRNIPIKCAQKLADTIEKTKIVGFGYVGTVFFLLPISLIYLSR